MGTVAIGDIHGNLHGLQALLAEVEPALAPEDTVVFLGDYIDRGPDTRGCIERILELREAAPCPVIALRGNHEDWMLRTIRDSRRHSWLLGMEALTTIQSYCPEAAEILHHAARQAGPALVQEKTALPYDVFFEAIPDAHLEFVKTLELCWQTEDALCVHAGLDPAVESLDDQPAEALLWGHEDFPERYEGEIPVVYGHWQRVVLDGHGRWSPYELNGTLCIDGSGEGVVTALRLPDRTAYTGR